jgi:hypothetical protein
MKMLHAGLSFAALAFCWQIAPGQGFVNMDFEDTTITAILINSFTGYYDYIATVPGWTWSPENNDAAVNADTMVSLNDIALDSSAVTLQGTNSSFAPSLHGMYSIFLQGGSASVPSTSYSAIWQTGQIPATAKSLIYWGGALQISFNGQLLTPVAIGNAANYTVWGVDISPYAGQTGELRFTKPWLDTNFSDGALLDNIQFSPVPVPEPSALALYGVFVLCLSGTRLMKRPNNSKSLFRILEWTSFLPSRSMRQTYIWWACRSIPQLNWVVEV